MVRSKQVAKKTAVTNYSFESEQSRRGGGKVYKKRVVVPNPTPKSSVARGEHPAALTLLPALAGLKVLKEIRRLQGSTQLLIPRKRFMAAVRSVAEKFRVGVRFQFMALLCIQVGSPCTCPTLCALGGCRAVRDAAVRGQQHAGPPRRPRDRHAARHLAGVPHARRPGPLRRIVEAQVLSSWWLRLLVASALPCPTPTPHSSSQLHIMMLIPSAFRLVSAYPSPCVQFSFSSATIPNKVTC